MTIRPAITDGPFDTDAVSTDDTFNLHFGRWWPTLLAEDLYPPETEVLPALIASIFSNLSLQGKKFLDVGCGEGRFGRLALRFGAQVQGCDISPQHVEISTRSFPTRHCNVTSLPWPDASFDIVLCNMVLIHVENLEAAVCELARVIVNEGRCIISIIHPFAEWAGDQPEFHDVLSRYLIPRETKWLFEDLKGKKWSVKYHHRPLHVYLNLFSRYFVLEEIKEKGSREVIAIEDTKRYCPVEYLTLELTRIRP